MKSIRFEQYFGPRLPPNVQMARIRRVMEAELTPLQRLTLESYYFHKKTIPEIAKERGVNPSTVSKTLKRAENNLRRHLMY